MDMNGTFLWFRTPNPLNPGCDVEDADTMTRRLNAASQLIEGCGIADVNPGKLEKMGLPPAGWFTSWKIHENQ